MTANVGNPASMPASTGNMMQQIEQAKPNEIFELDLVKRKYIENYNAAHREKSGELMYSRQLIFFKQAMLNNDKLAKCSKFSLYACFVTAAVNGYSLDPQDDEVYLIPRDGKACLDRQAGAHVRRLIRTGQIDRVEQANLVYDGDEFEVENGKVIRHKPTFKSDTIVAGYVVFILDKDGNRQKHFIYRKSDFESWRAKSPNPKTVEKQGQYGPYLAASLWDNGILGGTQPEPNFLRTKIVKHAAKDKSWSSGTTLVIVDNYTEVEIETSNEDLLPPSQPLGSLPGTMTLVPPAEVKPAATDDNSFTHAEEVPKQTKVFSSDNF